ncbi:DoxX family protein [Candidiatus Paracoxiella cheracis]|uniref:DoxX family protein n=1 Tax=Candidiatus Paracoxiella cheracis TaxID=3405120 RepID=UPI003BF48823
MARGCHALQNWGALIGRIFVSLIFIIAGIQKIVQYHAMAGMLAQMGLPSSQWLLILAIIFELGGGLLVFFGWFARFGAILLFIFVVVATFLFHSFWNFEGAGMVNQVHHFLKNLSILGALLYILAFGAGDYAFTRRKSVD